MKILMRAGLTFLLFASMPSSLLAAPGINDLLDYSNGENTDLSARLNAIKELGLQIGAQAGMIDRAKLIVDQVNKRAHDLDKIFEFQPLLSRDGWLPPVIETASQGVETKNAAQRLEFFGVSYKIVRPAIFVRVVPTWRDYVFNGLDDGRLTVDKLPDTLRPITAKEKRIWTQAVEDGWKIGADQANAIYNENLQKLKRDYMGMIKFKTLEANRMIKAPVLAVTPEVAEVHSDQINIGVGVKTIEVPARMEDMQGDWGLAP
jgi:defect-in-organelle-trafficking protein DotC